MIKFLRYKRVLYCGAVLGAIQEEDEILKYKKARGLFVEDPWGRVKLIFSKDDHGDSHPELSYAIDMFKLGAVTGFCFGGLTTAARKADDFRRSNDLSIFANRRELIKAYGDHNIMSFLNGGLKKAIPVGLFTFGFSLVSSCCEAYYNKPQIINSTVAGVVVGSFGRFFFGIKGMLSGGIVGGALGTFYGFVVWATCKASKTDQVELKYSQFALMNFRKQNFDRVTKMSAKEEKDVHSDTTQNT